MDGWRMDVQEAGEECERKRDFDVLPLSWSENNVTLPMGCREKTEFKWEMTEDLRFLIST